MKLKFSKMHGLGNDFMVVDGVRQSVSLSTEQIRLLGNRQLGIGFDQLLLVEAPREAGHDFRYRIFNNDGGEVEQCGNGARCFAKFVRDERLTDKSRISVETARGVISPEYLGDGQVRVDMGVPRFAPADLPFLADAEALTYALPVAGGDVEIGIASMGNPHAVQLVDDVDAAPVAEIGPLIENHPAFPQRVNAGFMQILNRGEIRLRVYERGAGETLACGTGACAAAVCGIRQGLLDARVIVRARGGDILIEWAGEGRPVIMTGPAVTVFRGEIEL
ncbi:diaminopimelate epimerase [Chromobacterium phragmitis]|uniref:Diaminopimelate epimerase n=3 Tax=Chromobacterium phragmitis TaxID=2202141 RepID=A0A344UDI2_9NEIS|nr:diaminopimelate epimerase [Chromobacterium phragmitis]AXE31939.1 diaminopimelate epimerase [Chromobacterium phragmitis]AXE33330.1 diaminopimelate epimerase [Chromobacterium phragmitis]